MHVHQKLTRCASTCNFMVFEYWNQNNFWALQSLGNKGCSLSLKAGFGAQLLRPGFTDSLLFFAMPVHKELTRCASSCNFMVFRYWNQINFCAFQSLSNKACSLSLKAGFGAPLFRPGFTDWLLFLRNGCTSRTDNMCLYLQLYGIWILKPE